MKIRSVDYAGTVASPGGAPPGGLPQVAFSGRSNVGKSSLINALLLRSRSKLARVSATPGKTQALNFYEVNKDFFLVDLPGYGFARVPEEVRASWSRLIEWYLGESGLVTGVVHLIDARHAPTKHDQAMVEYLGTVSLPTLIVLTKVDKLKRTERVRSLARAQEALGLEASQLLAFSSKTGEGRDALLGALSELLGARGEST
jgi:GTP-binding protein